MVLEHRKDWAVLGDFGAVIFKAEQQWVWMGWK